MARFGLLCLLYIASTVLACQPPDCDHQDCGSCGKHTQRHAGGLVSLGMPDSNDLARRETGHKSSTGMVSGMYSNKILLCRECVLRTTASIWLVCIKQIKIQLSFTRFYIFLVALDPKTVNDAMVKLLKKVVFSA